MLFQLSFDRLVGSKDFQGTTGTILLGPPQDQSRYEVAWEEHIREPTTLKPYVPITDLILFMANEYDCLMSGTAFADSLYFYHDELSLLTSNETKNG